MKAVFITQDCLLRDAQGEGLSEATARAVQTLEHSKLYTILLGIGDAHPVAANGPLPVVGNGDLLDWIDAADGRVDAQVACAHEDDACYCWGRYPGLLWEASRDLDVHLEESYILCDSPTDVLMGYMSGCRPILVLGQRSIEALYAGFQPDPADFAVAIDLAHAVDYIMCEEENVAELGHPRPVPMLPAGEAELSSSWPDDVTPDLLPLVTVYTPVASTMGRPSPTEIWRYASRNSGRQLLLVVVGGVWLSLGIAYLLTHLYRVQPFPEYVYYLTLQFIPRPIRGVMFIVTGVVVLWLAYRSVRRMSGRRPLVKPKG